MKIKQFFLGLATASCFAMPAFAAPIEFSINTISITPGTGYGSGAGNQNALDVVFTAAGAPSNFSLDLDGIFTKSFKVGTVSLNEECIDFGTVCFRNSRDETDNLDVTVRFGFVSPLTGSKPFIMTGTAYAGPVSDADVDYTLVFNPAEFTFGNGGKFSLDLGDLSFSKIASKDLNATITLLNAPVNEGGGNDLPEPGSLALIGLGLAGLRMGARRRKA